MPSRRTIGAAPSSRHLEPRTLLSAGDWRLATGLVHTVTHLPFRLGGQGIRATSVGNLAFFTGAGSSGGVTLTDKVAVYNTITGKWSQIRLSQPRANVAAVGVGSKALFAGGYIDKYFSQTYQADIYDVSTGRRSTAQLTGYSDEFHSPLPVGVDVDDLAVFSTGDVYDSSTGQMMFTQRLVPPGAERLPPAATSVDHLALFGGGQIGAGATSHPTDEVNVYDARTAQWSTQHLSQARDVLAATSVGNTALFAGGYDNNGFESDVVDLYNATTGQWSTAHLSQARFDLAATSLGNLAIFGGGSDRVDVYDASSQTWFTTSLSVSRAALAATTAGGKAFFAGGVTGPHGVASNVVDVFTLGPAVTGSVNGKPGRTVSVTVQSTGEAELPAGVTVSVYTSTGQTLDASSVLLGQTTLAQPLAAGASTVVNVPTTIPGTLPKGKYHLVAAIDDNAGPGPVVIASSARASTIRAHGARHGAKTSASRFRGLFAR